MKRIVNKKPSNSAQSFSVSATFNGRLSRFYVLSFILEAFKIILCCFAAVWDLLENIMTSTVKNWSARRKGIIHFHFYCEKNANKMNGFKSRENWCSFEIENCIKIPVIRIAKMREFVCVVYVFVSRSETVRNVLSRLKVGNPTVLRGKGNSGKSKQGVSFMKL